MKGNKDNVWIDVDDPNYHGTFDIIIQPKIV